MSTVVLTGGDIVDQDGRRTADVSIDTVTGRIAAVGDELKADHELAAAGCIITPGFVDLHSHLRQPGHENAETIETGSRAAALGGYCAVVAMPNTTPCTDSAAVVQEVLEWGASALCEIKPSAAISVNRAGVELAPMGELAELGVSLFTDDGNGVQDAGFMRSALQYASGLTTKTGAPVVLAQHCEVEALSHGGVMHEGSWSSRLGLGGQPSEAEELMVMRDIVLSRKLGVRVHMQHLSTAGSVEMVRQAKADGVLVTAEATTHHFTLTDECCSTYDPTFKVHPPLRTAADVAAIKAGLADGTIDAIATDHAPHTQHSKERPFDQAPPGMLGLETAFAVANTELELPLQDLLALLSWKPAAIADLTDYSGVVTEGAVANLAVIDPDRLWTIDGAELASKARNTPYDRMQVTGQVRHTIFRGEAVVIDGKATR